MKMLSAALMLVLSLTAFASSETKTFFFDGTQDSVQMSLRAEKTHTEYRYEQIRTTCTRQEVYYSTVCHNTQNGPVCRTVPHYRTIYYPCIQTIRVPYEVKDYDVEANVNLSVAALPEATAGETFKVTLDGDRLSLSAIGSKKFFILLKKQDQTSRMSGSVKFIDATYATELVEAAPIVKALEMTSISMKDSVLSFDMGPVAAPEFIGYHLTVKKAPIFGSDTVLFDRELASGEIQINAQDSASSATVHIDRLGVELSSGRHTLTAKAFFKHAGSILNASQFEKTEASRTLIYKVR
ncbi:MAG: hypothetical protein ACLGHN_13885 [Bacteriovoracia bacterium]